MSEPRDPEQRWRVIDPHQTTTSGKLNKPVTRWMTKQAARAYAETHGGIVENWGSYVTAWRAAYPLTRRRDRS